MAAIMAVAVLGLCVLVGYVIYMCFLHPLASIPGPKLAAISRFWLLHVELGKKADKVLLELHQKHGPLVRIAPDEVSFFDIDLYHDAVFSQNTKYLKAPYFYDAFNNPAANVFTERNKQVHSGEKRLMSHAFSRSNILSLQNHLYANTRRWVAQLQSHAEGGKTIPLWYAAQCLTLENTSCFSYGASDGALETTDFHHPLLIAMEDFAPAVVLFQHFPILQRIAPFIQALLPNAFPSLNEGAIRGLDLLQNRKRQNAGDTGMIMFESMMAQAAKREVRLDTNRLIQNGGLMLQAGTGTTGVSLAAAIHLLVARPQLWMQLQLELLAAFPDLSQDPDVVELENVILLDAVIKETLRFVVPIRSRTPRVVPTGGLDYRGTHIPEGTIISSTSFFSCRDSNVFPEPEEFKPERWLVEDTKEMQRHLTIFSRGSRSCIGQNLALVEMKIALSQVLLRLNPGELVDKELKLIDFMLTVPENLLKVRLNAR